MTILQTQSTISIIIFILLMNFDLLQKDLFGEPSWPLQKSSFMFFHQERSDRQKSVKQMLAFDQQKTTWQLIAKHGFGQNNKQEVHKDSFTMGSSNYNFCYYLKQEEQIRQIQDQQQKVISNQSLCQQLLNGRRDTLFFNNLSDQYSQNKIDKLKQEEESDHCLDYEDQSEDFIFQRHKQKNQESTRFLMSQQSSTSDFPVISHNQLNFTIQEMQNIKDQLNKLNIQNKAYKIPPKQNTFYDIQRNILQKLKLCEIQDKKRRQQNSNKQNNISQKYMKYKIFDKRQKQYLVCLSDFLGVKTVSEYFKISINNIARWRKNCNRKMGGGRRLIDEQLQQKMISYVKKIIQAGKYLTRAMIQNKAKQISRLNNFKASKGWLQRFIKRNFPNISFRRYARMPK